MIDEKKIEEAKEAFIADKKILGVIAINDLACGFKEGVNWAINWLLDNLWHTDIYEIEINKPILIQIRGKADFVVLKLRNKYEVNEYPCCFATRWLYIEDLIKGGK